MQKFCEELLNKTPTKFIKNNNISISSINYSLTSQLTHYYIH